jgi:hypothetical protein
MVDAGGDVSVEVAVVGMEACAASGEEAVAVEAVADATVVGAEDDGFAGALAVADFPPPHPPANSATAAAAASTPRISLKRMLMNSSQTNRMKQHDNRRIHSPLLKMFDELQQMAVRDGNSIKSAKACVSAPNRPRRAMSVTG